MDTNTEIHFLCRRKSHLCTIQRHQALETRWPGLLLQVAFSALLNHEGAFHGLCGPSVKGINKTAWGAKLIFNSRPGLPVSCASPGSFVFDCLL